MIVGNDVSKWQGDINFEVYKNNTNFLIAKCSEGTGYIDTKFARNQAEARRCSIPFGTYHFARPDLANSAQAEADFYLKTVGKPVEGELFVLDYEPTWNGDAVSWCKAWLDRVQSSIGVKPLIYLNQSQATSYNWQPVVDGGYGLWIAAYTYDPNNNTFKTGAWKFAAMQQWTNMQQVPGISGNVDGDVFFGTVDTFKRYGYQTPAPTPPPPPVEPPTPTPPPVTPPPVTPPTPEPQPLPTPEPICCTELRGRVEKLEAKFTSYEKKSFWKLLFG